MARGWESKAVESQQAEAAEQEMTSRPHLTAKDAAACRQKENLRLARQSILQQIEASTSPRHRKLLEAALADLDEKLKRLMVPI